MATGDIARLVLQVDAQVELARRNISALAAAVEGDAKKMDQSLARVDQAHARLARTSGSARIAQMEFTHVITASTDAINAGIPVSRVFAMEIGRIAQAAEFATQGTGAFSKFLAGPWGLAVQVGISLLAMLALRHGEAGKAASEQKIEDMDLVKALKALDDATKGAITSERQHQIELLDSARIVNAKAIATRDLTKAQLENALAFAQQRENAAREQAPNLRGEAKADILAAAAIARETVASLQARLRENEAAVLQAQQRRSAALIPLMEQRAKELNDPAENARAAAGRRVDALRAAFDKAGDNSEAAVQRFVHSEAAINAARDAEIKKIEEQRQAQHSATALDRPSGRHITVAEAESIVRGVGGQVNSGFRSHARQQQLYDEWVAAGRPSDNPVAVPGTSGHERGTSVDVQMRAGLSLGKLLEAFRAQGVAAHGFPERGHYHIDFAGPQGPSQETLARRSAAQATSARRDQDSFASAHSAADQRLAAAQEEAARNAEDSVDLQIIRIGKEREALDEATRRNATEHKWSQAETATVLELNRRWAQQKVSTAIARDEARSARDTLQINQAGLRNEQDLIRAREQLATTTKERRDAAVALLDIAQQQERNDLEALLASKEATDAQKQIARARLDMLPQLRGLAVQAIDRQYERPGARFARDLGSRDLNEQLDEVKIRGLQGLEDGLADVISGTESVSHAFKRMAQSIIADLARIAIEREIILPLANMLFGGSGGGGGSLLSAIGASTGSGSLPGFASGGNPPVGRPYIVGERGPEIRIDRTPSTIIPNHVLRGAGRGGTVNLAVHISTSDMLEAHVEESSARHAAAVVPAASANAVNQVVRLLTRRGING